MMLNIERKVPYGQDSKARDWDFTLSVKREIVSGGGTVQTAVSLKTVHALLLRGVDVAKIIGWQFIQSLQRIIP